MTIEDERRYSPDADRLVHLMHAAGIKVVKTAPTDRNDGATAEEVLWSILQHFILYPPPGRIPLRVVPHPHGDQ